MKVIKQQLKVKEFKSQVRAFVPEVKKKVRLEATFDSNNTATAEFSLLQQKLAGEKAAVSPSSTEYAGTIEAGKPDGQSELF